MSSPGKRQQQRADLHVYEPVTVRTLGSDSRSEKSPLPEGNVLIDLTDDGDHQCTFRPLQCNDTKMPSAREEQALGDSVRKKRRRVVTDLTETDEMDLDEPPASQQRHERDSPGESSLFVGRLYDEEMQLDTSKPTPPKGSLLDDTSFPLLGRAPDRPSWTPPPDSPKQSYRKHSSNGLAAPVHQPVSPSALSPTPSISTTAEQQIPGRIAERPKGGGTYDTCFGMLILEAEASLGAILPAECTPVIAGFTGAIAKLYQQDQGVCTAILVSRPLGDLLEQFTVRLAATICGKKRKLAKQKRHATDAELAPRPCLVRMLVYGLKDEGNAVGDALSQAGLFLQHPGEHEIDKGIKYHNPQYLLPPGQDMPPMEALRVSLCCRPQTSTHSASRSSLGELERSQVLRIFDSASGFSPPAMIKQSPRLQTKLKRHQLEALVMMVEKEAGIYDNASFPPLWKPSPSHKGRYQHITTLMFEMQKPPPVGGGILADEMGLGKTLSALSLICHSLDALEKLPASSQSKVSRATLVVTPKSTIYSWEKQIQTHIQKGQVRFIVYHGQSGRQELHKSASYDIVLTTYDTLRSDCDKGGPLSNEKWARVVLDEAHRIRNRLSKTFKTVFEIPAQKRWCLTGTPIQNSLADFGALLSFVGVPPFDQEGQFAKYVESPVISKEKGSLDVLRALIAATTLRRTKANHTQILGLPCKTERVEIVGLSAGDRRLYEFFKRQSYLIATLGKSGAAPRGEGKARAGGGNTSQGSNILLLIGLLRLICNHGEALLPDLAAEAWRNRDTSSIDWNMLELGVDTCVDCGSEIDSLNATESAVGRFACGHAICTDCSAKLRMTISTCLGCGINETSPSSRVQSSHSLLIPTGSRSPSTSDVDPMSPSRLDKRASPSRFGEQYTPSDKVKALLRNIENGSSEKHVIFSYWTKMLDQIAKALNMSGLRFQRIDGQASLQQRKDAIEKFSNDAGYRVMIASIGAAGEGIELTAATTAHIVEPHWNPMAEAQAIDRVHRFGQERDVTVIRYVVLDSIEEYVQWVQADKMRLIKDSFSATDGAEEKVRETRWNRLLESLE
ncbi:SNF2 family N-terminal domain-containing protein [Nemania abortiva]|nr:SNF2 family N-terminal domain-containing protein [Nemania abortiva]